MLAWRQLVTPQSAACLQNGILGLRPALVGLLRTAQSAPLKSRTFRSSPSHGDASTSDDTETSVPGNDLHHVLGTATPVTKRLWVQRYTWTDEKLAAAPPRGPAHQLPKPPRPTVVTYPFSTDELLVEHYRNPWGEVRIGRILEDLDSLAAFVAFEHCDVGDESTRPPLLVTAGVEAIELSSSKLNLQQDMQMAGRAVWTGNSSVDIRLELQQGGKQQLTALFTFVGRDMLTNKAHPISPVMPRSKQDQEFFCERQRTNQQRRAAKAAGGGEGTAHHVSPQGQQWAEQLLAAAKIKRDMPALADANQLLMDDTSLENTFTCQPQQRNVHGRMFGGFLMRRAFELAHVTAYLFAGCRPHAVEIAQITFRRPVNIGDLIKFKSWVTHTEVSPHNPGQGLAHIKVEASVTQPEKRQSAVTNTFNILLGFSLTRDASSGGGGGYIPPKQVLPNTERQALEIAQLFGPGQQ